MSAADDELEPVGCALATLRLLGCTVLLWAIMFAAILIAGLFFKLFF